MKTVGELRKYLEQFSDDTKLIGSGVIDQGRGSVCTVTEGIDVTFYGGEDEDDTFDYFDDGEEKTLTNVLVIEVSGQETHSE